MATALQHDTPSTPARPALKLYEATEELRAVELLLEESEGELTPEIEEALARASGTFQEKAARVGLVIREKLAAAKMAEGAAEALMAGEVDRLRTLAARAHKSAESLTRYLTSELQRANVSEVKHPLCPLKFHKTPPKLVGTVDAAGLYDMQDLEDGMASWRHLIRVKPETYELDRAAALREAKAGNPIPPGLTVEAGVKLVVG